MLATALQPSVLAPLLCQHTCSIQMNERAACRLGVSLNAGFRHRRIGGSFWLLMKFIVRVLLSNKCTYSPPQFSSDVVAELRTRSLFISCEKTSFSAVCAVETVLIQQWCLSWQDRLALQSCIYTGCMNAHKVIMCSSTECL